MTDRERELADGVSTSGRRGFLAGAGTVAGLALLCGEVGAASGGTDMQTAVDEGFDPCYPDGFPQITLCAS